MNTVCISTKMSTPEKVGDKTQGVPFTSKSRGNCPPVHPWIYAHDQLRFNACKSRMGLQLVQ